MTTDRELMELAAKAAGYDLGWMWDDWCREDRVFYFASQSDGYRKGERWNPRDDDGDALRLAVKLGLQLDMRDPETRAFGAPTGRIDEHHRTDPYAATRRAIVRAAAEIGKAMS